MSPAQFRAIPKEMVRARIPLDLERKLRKESHRKRWSLSKTLADIIAKHFNANPEKYGIESSREPVTETTAV